MSSSINTPGPGCPGALSHLSLSAIFCGAGVLSSNFHSFKQAWVPFWGHPKLLLPGAGKLITSPKGEGAHIPVVIGQRMPGFLVEDRGTPNFYGGLGPFLGDPQFLFSRAMMPESCLGGFQPAPVFIRSGCPVLLGGDRWVPVTRLTPANLPGGRDGTRSPNFQPIPSAHLCPKSAGLGERGLDAQPEPHPGRPQVCSQCARQLPRAQLPAPHAEGSPRSRRAGGRVWRRPMSALAVSGSRAGSARLALGTRWAAAGGAWGVLAPGWARLVAG